MSKRLLPLLAALLVLNGCVLRSQIQREAAEGAYEIYFVAPDSTDGAAVAGEAWIPGPGEDVLPALLDRLMAGPEDPELLSPFPAGLRLLSWEREGERLHLDFSEHYEGLSGVDLTLANYCLALTLCQAEDVESVYLTVEGAESPHLYSGDLSSGDVVLSGAEEEPVAVEAALWFPQRGGEGLGVEYRKLCLTEQEDLTGALLQALGEGPGYAGLAPSVPAETELLGALTEKGICYLDLSGAFLEGAEHDGAELRRRVYSVVNTLTENLETVERVQIQVEGSAEGLPVELSGALRPQPAEEDGAGS